MIAINFCIPVPVTDEADGADDDDADDQKVLRCTQSQALQINQSLLSVRPLFRFFNHDFYFALFIRVSALACINQSIDFL